MSKIALINGSPRGAHSASKVLLTELKSCLRGGEADEYLLSSQKSDCLEEILDHDILVFFFPLYVDGIPSHLLHLMSRMEALRAPGRIAPTAADCLVPAVYAVCNCGFYEGIQCRLALDMVKNWCRRAGLIYKQGLGFGGGGMLTAIQSVPYGRGPRKNFSIELQRLAAQIAAQRGGDSRFVTPNFPRFLYKLSAEMGWRQAAKQNGLKTSDLSRRL